MKVISILQPWATLAIIGAKKIETRSWNTKYRGEILIHASAGKQGMKIMDDLEFKKYLTPLFWDDPRSSFHFGAIIGKVNLKSTVESQFCFLGNEFSTESSGNITHIITDQELAFGDFSPNRYGWLLTDPYQFWNPIPAKGSLGLWNYELPDHSHLPIKGGHATFSSPPDKETIDAVNKMAELAWNISTKK